MAALIEAMRLAIRYWSTTLHHDYTKSMLAAAHVLAMDAKNLLDVVDSIRTRYPDVDWRRAFLPAPSPPPLSNQSSVLEATHPPLSNQSSVLEDEVFAPKPDFKINQPVTTTHAPESPKEHTSLPSNRVSTLIQNYNVYGNVKDQHIYGNSEVGGSHQNSTSSVDEPKIDDAPMQSVKSRVQALAKMEAPPIYSVSKKIPIEQNSGHSDQG
ncbi:unnamed protein product [Plutella xylostella]|uniref:(diamondback moth) hypothetical protein n=1 Tax=Plutella xylostella TaxID=51655 RepID=A0A8S4FAV7_PLUXY|nr:unnamed protein product [Plutella xylostella]